MCIRDSRYVDCVCREIGTGEGQQIRVPGHQIAEMALAKLYLVTDVYKRQPDGTLKVEISVGNELAYQVMHGNDTILSHSNICLLYTSCGERQERGTYHWCQYHGKRNDQRYHYRF